MSPGAVDAAAGRLALPALGPVVDALAARYGAGDDPTTVTVRGLDAEGQQALADLLGEARTRGTAPRLAVARVVAALGLQGAADLREAVLLLRGPIHDRRAQRADADAARSAVRQGFLADVRALRLPWDVMARDAWLDRVEAFGPRGGLERHRARLAGVVAVLERLPAEDLPVPVLAQLALGDPHGLDPGRTVRGFVLDALAACGWGDAARDAEGARALWEAAGVVPDPLSSTVLVLGLAPPGDDLLSAFLRASAAVREPAVVTLAQLRRWPVAPLSPAHGLFVVENPSLVLAAGREALGAAVLICSSGRPTIAVVTLLRQLTAGGAVAHQHADFDHQGLAITAWLQERAGTHPWLMDAASYARAAGADPPSGTARLRVPLPPTPWDHRLAPLMTETGVPAYEEAVADELLQAMRDLARG